MFSSTQAEQAAKKKKSALSHSMMRELKSQMFDTPEEISHEADTRFTHIFFCLGLIRPEQVHIQETEVHPGGEGEGHV